MERFNSIWPKLCDDTQLWKTCCSYYDNRYIPLSVYIPYLTKPNRSKSILHTGRLMKNLLLLYLNGHVSYAILFSFTLSIKDSILLSFNTNIIQEWYIKLSLYLYKMCPMRVLFPASTCPTTTKFKRAFSPLLSFLYKASTSFTDRCGLKQKECY